MSTEVANLVVHASQIWIGPGRLLDDAAIALSGSRVVYAGPADGAPRAHEEIEGDWFLMPGVVDHHVHIRLADPLEVLLGGVTLVRDLGWRPDEIFPLADISAATEFDGPLIVAAGPIITARGGYPSRADWAPPGTALEIDGAESAAGAVERIASDDPAVIKVALNDEAGPTLTDGELVSICTIAHDRGLRVAAHVQGRGQTERALGAGVDELAHTPWTERIGDDVMSALARNLTIVTTLDIHSYGARTPALELAVDNLRRFVEAAGTIRYGTDLGNGPIPPGIHAGEARHMEIAGLGREAILEAMSGGPGIVGLGASPLEDLDALGDVRLVVRAGRVVRRAT